MPNLNFQRTIFSSFLCLKMRTLGWPSLAWRALKPETQSAEICLCAHPLLAQSMPTSQAKLACLLLVCLPFKTAGPPAAAAQARSERNDHLPRERRRCQITLFLFSILTEKNSKQVCHHLYNLNLYPFGTKTTKKKTNFWTPKLTCKNKIS